MTYGLTRFIESIVINSFIGGGERNQFDAFDPNEISDLRTLAAKSNVNLTSHEAFQRNNTTLTPVDNTLEIVRNISVVFVKNTIDTSNRCLLEKRVEIARLQNSGIHGKFPFILPSREKSFRD